MEEIEARGEFCGLLHQQASAVKLHPTQEDQRGEVYFSQVVPRVDGSLPHLDSAQVGL